MKINADGTLSLPAQTLTTQGVEELLHELAKARQKMKPEVVQRLSKATSITQRDPTLYAGKSTDTGLVTMTFRHEGFGWISFELGEAEANELKRFLGVATGEVQDIGQDDLPDGSLPH